MLVLLPGICLSESPELTEQSLKAAESKLACCYKQAAEILTDLERRDWVSVLKESQAAWVKYRDDKRRR